MNRPHRPLHTTLLALLVTAASGGGCLVPLGGGEVGALTVGWSFGDDRSCAAAGVQLVSVQAINGDTASGAEAACSDGAALIEDLPVGGYDVLLDAAGDVLWSGREKIDIVAGQTADEGVVKLKPVLGPLGASLSLTWTFADAASCAEAGIDEVDIVVREGAVQIAQQTFLCGVGGGTVERLPSGPVNVDVVGRAGDVINYEATRLTTLSAFPADLGLIEMEPVRARVTVAWAFDGDARCELAGVTDVSVQVIDDDGLTVGGARVACLAGQVRLNALPAAHLSFVVEGLALDQRRWTSTAAVTLAAGDNTPLVIDLEPAFASAAIRWRFADAGNTADCAAANVATVTVQVFDDAGLPVSGGSFACAAGVGVINGLPAGSHRFVTDGFNSGGTISQQDTTGNPRGVTALLALGDNVVDVTLE